MQKLRLLLATILKYIHLWLNFETRNTMLSNEILYGLKPEHSLNINDFDGEHI